MQESSERVNAAKVGQRIMWDFFPPDVEQEPALLPISLTNSPILGASECLVDITVNPVAVWS